MDKTEENMNIKKAVLETIVFFDIFDFPLTHFEIWKYAEVECELNDVAKILSDSSLAEVLGEKNGLYFLKGRDEIYITRMKRYAYSFKKFKRALFVAKIFRWLPWIKMIAVGNVIGGNNTKADSDIDLFIVTQANRIWLARLGCVLITEILRLRPKGKNVKDKICLSFFISEANLDLQSVVLDNDYYFRYWLAELTPIFIKEDVYKKFITANQWFLEKMPNWILYKSYKRSVADIVPRFYNATIDFLCGWSENIAKKLQEARLPAELRTLMNKDSRVVVSDKMLKFHKNDRREEYNKLFKGRVEKYR